MSWWENLIIASFLFSISDQTSKQCVRVPKFLRNSQYIVQWQWEKKQMICVDLRIVNHLRGFDLQKVSRKTKWARSQSSSSCDNAKIDGRRNGTCSSHWSRSSCWSDGRWCPATAAPARSSRTPPTAVSCYRPPPPPPPAKTPRLTAPAARSEAARRGRAARAGGRGGASSRAGAAASPSPRGSGAAVAYRTNRDLVARAWICLCILQQIHQLLQDRDLKRWGWMEWLGEHARYQKWDRLVCILIWFRIG